MSPPRRRSSRLRTVNGTPGKPATYTPRQLTSLTERDETPPQDAQSSLDAILSTPLMQPTTPATGATKPSFAAMHPELTHKSTAPGPDSGLRHGFTDLPSQPPSHNTPTKVGISSSFDFRFARPTTLGPEAQRMMDDLREEALKIKAKMAAEREEEKRLAGEDTASAMGGRKFAQAKGKVGRFSDVHMAEFKKMDSIAGHPSSFRAQPGKVTPASHGLKRTQSKAQLEDGETSRNMNTLKRTQSKAKLEDRDGTQARSSNSTTTATFTNNLKRTQSKPNLTVEHSQGPRDTPFLNKLKRTQSKAKLNDRQVAREESKTSQTDRLENSFPAKRARQRITDDASWARPVSRNEAQETKALPTTPMTSRQQPSFLTTITSPTQASLARAASVMRPNTQIPTLSKSPSKPILNGTPHGLAKPGTFSNLSSVLSPEPRRVLNTPGKFDRVKAFMRNTSASMRRPTAIPTLGRSPSRLNVEKSLPPVPTTPVGLGSKTAVQSGRTYQAGATLPSALKSGIPRSISKLDLGAKAQTAAAVIEITYPSLNMQSQNDDFTSENSTRSFGEHRPLPAVPGAFTFRSNHMIDFSKSPHGFGSSPGQASIRQVRPSIIPGSMPGSFPAESNKENVVTLPAYKHGMSNKKRRRADSEDEHEEGVKHSPKKQKPAVAEGDALMAPRLLAEKMASPSMIPSPAKKKGLSLTRLNMLSRPKMRN